MSIEIKTTLRKSIDKRLPLAGSIYKISVACRLIDSVKKKYGKDTFILFTRGATGDFYIQLMLFRNYLRKQGIRNYVFVGDPVGGTELAKLFQEKRFVKVSGYKSECLEKYCMLMGNRAGNIKILFPWTYSLYINRCRVRMTERFDFMDTYLHYVFELQQPHVFTLPQWERAGQTVERLIKQKGLRQKKTVVISPDANSVTALPIEFWNELIDEIRSNGYDVLIHTNKKCSYAAPVCFLSYTDLAGLLEYAGTLVAVRSGLCDVMATVDSHKIILYPEMTIPPDYSEHRSEKEFSGIIKMRMPYKNTITELSTNLIRNITQSEYETIEQSQCKALKDSPLQEILQAVRQEGDKT